MSTRIVERNSLDTSPKRKKKKTKTKRKIKKTKNKNKIKIDAVDTSIERLWRKL